MASSFNFNAPLESTIGQLNLHLNRLRVSEDNLVHSDQARSAHATNVHAGIDIMTSMIDKAEAHHVMLKRELAYDPGYMTNLFEKRPYLKKSRGYQYINAIPLTKLI